jgi:hypothetical protein
MKKILFFLLFPFLCISQDIVNDTVYWEKQSNIYYLISQTFYSDSTMNYNKKYIGDSLSAIYYTINGIEKISNKMSEFAYPFIFKNKSQKQIIYYNNLHQQISGRPVYTSTAIRDTATFNGDWTLNFDGEIIPGVIRLNANNRLIFNPDKSKVYSITTNLLLSTFTNQISFTFNNVKYDLYKFANGKFSTVEGDVKLVKKE